MARREHLVTGSEEDTVDHGDEPTAVIGDGHSYVRASVLDPPPEPYLDPGPSYAVSDDPHPPAPVAPGPGRRGFWVGPFDDFWPALAVLLLAALIALGVAWYVTQQSERPVPAVTSMRLESAVSRLQEEGFKTTIISRAATGRPGVVFDQRPQAGVPLEEGSEVSLFVSKGPARIEVPDAVGLSERRARDRLAAAGLEARVFEVSSQTAVGTVLAQHPVPGERVSKDESVRLNVSAGPVLANVPSVVGQSRTSAEPRVVDAGFEVRVSEVFSEEPSGVVVSQQPTAGERLTEGGSVHLTVSKGPGLVEVPSLVGLRRRDAQAQLANVGLEANVFLVPSIEPAGTVVAQHPTGGRIEKGSGVRINVSNGQTPP